MTETTNITESRKTTRSFFTLFIALVVATISVSLLAMSAAAKPAEASTTCDSAAAAPTRVWVNNVPYVQFFMSIKCSAPIQNAYMESMGGVYVNGSWKIASQPNGALVSESGWFNTSKSTYTATLRLKCTEPYTLQSFRTHLRNPKVQALNGTVNALPNRYSSVVDMKC